MQFESKDVIINWCKVVGKKANIMVLIGRSEKARNQFILHCERGEKYQKPKKKLYLPELRISSFKRGKPNYRDAVAESSSTESRTSGLTVARIDSSASFE